MYRGHQAEREREAGTLLQSPSFYHTTCLALCSWRRPVKESERRDDLPY